jgi:hypothetical protein
MSTQAKQSRIVIRIDDEDLEWLRAEGKKLGLDAAAFGRMLWKQRQMFGDRVSPEISETDRRPLPRLPAYEPSGLAVSDQPDGAPDLDLDSIVNEHLTAATSGFEVASPGDMTAVRPIGPRRTRSARDWAGRS